MKTILEFLNKGKINVHRYNLVYDSKYKEYYALIKDFDDFMFLINNSPESFNFNKVYMDNYLKRDIEACFDEAPYVAVQPFHHSMGSADVTYIYWDDDTKHLHILNDNITSKEFTVDYFKKLNK